MFAFFASLSYHSSLEHFFALWYYAGFVIVPILHIGGLFIPASATRLEKIRTMAYKQARRSVSWATLTSCVMPVVISAVAQYYGWNVIALLSFASLVFYIVHSAIAMFMIGGTEYAAPSVTWAEIEMTNKQLADIFGYR